MPGVEICPCCNNDLMNCTCGPQIVNFTNIDWQLLRSLEGRMAVVEGTVQKLEQSVENLHLLIVIMNLDPDRAKRLMAISVSAVKSGKPLQEVLEELEKGED